MTPESAPHSPNPTSPKKEKVIDSFWTFLVATAFLGPLALPLLWRNPKYKVSTKVVGSIAVLLFTWLLVHFSTSFMSDMAGDIVPSLDFSPPHPGIHIPQNCAKQRGKAFFYLELK